MSHDLGADRVQEGGGMMQGREGGESGGGPGGRRGRSGGGRRGGGEEGPRGPWEEGEGRQERDPTGSVVLDFSVWYCLSGTELPVCKFYTYLGGQGVREK